ncbi:MAG: AraC family transcriptional regulator [Lachnospiraceae bacterium]|nr:AraC family transcriptional regulator [Lachnospiraceae bacterium]
MPLPLKNGYNFNYARIWHPPFFEMTAAEEYTDFYAVSYLINGEILVYSPDFTKILHEGDISFNLKNCYCRSSYISDKPRENILLKFTDSMIIELLQLFNVEKFDDIFIDRPTNIHLPKEVQEEVLSIMNEIEQEWNSYNEYSEILLKGLLHRLIILFLNEPYDGSREPMPEPKKNICLFNAIEYIKANLHDSPSLNKTAEHINISASYLSKIFVNQLHTPYSAFLLNEKILRAQKLLAGSELTMEEIARQAGFSSNTYFSDCFKRMTGTTPLQFRRSYK